MTFDPLKNQTEMAGLISEITGTPIRRVNRRLEKERREAGANVKADFAKAIKSNGGERYVYNAAMERFYETTDAFLYELAIWNLNRFKQQMGGWSCDWITKHLGPSNVLSIGDGMGFECLRIARAGHDVTYFEVPGYCAQFAQKLFEKSRADITQLTDPASIPQGQFDALICLDVLEHVPDPPAFVKMLMANLKPGGIFIVHAPYYMIHPNYPTHVHASRKFSGDLSLYRDAGFRVLDGRMMWNPVVLQAPGGTALPSSIVGKLAIATGKPYLMMGRKSSKPFKRLHRLKRRQQQWFTNPSAPNSPA